MPMPKRHQIREYVKTLLTNCHEAVGEKVYSNRVSAYWRSELPCISIYTRDEEVRPRTMSAKEYIRKMALVIEIHAEAKEDLDILLDEIAEAVETKIIENPTLGSLATEALLQSTEIELNAETSTTPIGALSLVYSITYIK